MAKCCRNCPPKHNCGTWVLLRIFKIVFMSAGSRLRAARKRQCINAAAQRASMKRAPLREEACVRCKAPTCVKANFFLFACLRAWAASECNHIKLPTFAGLRAFSCKATRAHGVVVSHPLSMREAQGSIPCVSNFALGLAVSQ